MTSGLVLLPPQIMPMHNRRSTTIDTNTLIEIHHDRNDVDLYYTLDGNKPDRFVTLTTRKSTLAYRKPFYISRQIGIQGRVVIKAIAVSSDGLYESGIATRMFTIRVVPPDHPNSVDDENKYVHLLQQERQLLMEKLQTENDHLQRKSWENTQRFINEPFSKEKLSRSPYLDPTQSPLDLPRCAHCLAPKTDDPYTRYCTECGLPWQQLTHQPPITPAVRTCSRCASAIPFNLDACVVCETPASMNHSSSAPSLMTTQVNVLCPKCKFDNPSHARTCAMCQNPLFPVTHPAKRASVSVKPDSTNNCPECQRVINKSQARFCDWCGASRHPKPAISIACSKCQAKNQSTAKFCLSCGCVMQVPLRLIDTRLSQDLNNPSNSMIAYTVTDPSINARWLNAKTNMIYDRQSTLMNKSEAATQTYGIYYPSIKDLNHVMNQNRQLLEKQEFPQRPSRLTTSSPGKGYWKRQIDHVYTHLQAYAADRPEFRSLIGEPVMGPLVRAHVEENNHEVIVQVVFRRNDNENSSNLLTKDRPLFLHDGFDSDDEYSREKSRSTKPKTRPHSASASDSKKTVDQRLIELLEEKPNKPRKGSVRHVDITDEVRRLLKHGADGNARNDEGYPVLHLAVRNEHHDCLEILIKDGRARLDQKGPSGNTALHECCLLRSDGIEPLRILLKLGGQTAWKNKKGESVIDLATKQQCPELLDCIRAVRDQQEAKEHRKSASNNGYRYSGKAETKM